MLDKKIVGIIVIVVVFVLWYFLLFTHFNGRIHKLSQDVERLKRIKNSDIPQLQSKIRREKRLLNSYASILPLKNEVPALLTNICLVVKNCDVNLFSFNPQKEEDKDMYVSVPVRLRTRSTFDNLSCVFSNFLNMRKIVDVKDFSLTNPELQEDGTVLIDGDFILMTYYLKEGR
ncbi:MAG: type 4a pilus biogenesis protein PilO [Deltaproteobacteria bacterium]|nr:type 4a pilus biogenesis protein PilO [Deltaproteobacteria bacterium]